ncbi:PH domain-containing protein [Mycobacterium sp. CVI_P3]|uniref:PH domain-containing protein n=1 Tax=Mycobacterium pinniadriaticum TaxID=2994102 RepID=A0ABT3S852_9MYCO|nr:PH domain-containing protein [Mycobacterium pinniadriaticum]MCX2929250.1 PH domain-containing protein [Mycobacterium pinniadriaticum]MCX2935675.1 PH domain-containing protein [Mycobacterium pinniadriaticum]
MQQTEWGPKSGAVAGLGVAGILMAIFCVTVVTDPPGRILIGIAAAGLLVFAIGSWRARPRLAIAGEALVYRGWFRTQTLPRADITLIRITEFRRIGRKTRLLEIETGADQLIVLSRWDLGVDPLPVLDALTDAGFAGN